MKTRIRTVEIEEDVFELNRAQLLLLKTFLRGGNALSDNVKLLNAAADGPVTPDMANALRQRAGFLASGIKMIDDLLWPTLPSAQICCASCKQPPKPDCDNPACAFRGVAITSGERGK